MPLLEGQPVQSAGHLQSVVGWGELRERYDVDGFTVRVDDPDEAERLVAENPHLSFADAPEPTVDDGPERATATTDGVEFDGESDTCEAVKTDGEVCGRDLPCHYHDNE
jgi:hypothetical protein